jgi:hypothetical protein
MHPIHWLFTHPNEAQVINILVTAFLTLTLIVITARYARTTSRSVRIMEADVRARLKPIPHLGFTTTAAAPGQTKRTAIVTIRSDNAPLRIVGLEIVFATPKDKVEAFEMFRQDIVEVGTPFTGHVVIERIPPDAVWLASLTYKDISGLLIYTTAFDENGFLSEATPVDPKELFTRIRLSWRRLRRRF